jgi:hypothetical protein
MTLSHSRLEERLAAMRWSLAGALAQAEQTMSQRRSRSELGEVLLEVIASQAQVQAASLHWADAGALGVAPVATLGAGSSSSRLHPFVQRAWDNLRLVTVVDAGAAQGGSGVLAAVPVLTSSGCAVGVVAIHQMSFLAFQSEQLTALATLVSQLGDMMHDRLESQLAAAEQTVPERVSRAAADGGEVAALERTVAGRLPRASVAPRSSHVENDTVALRASSEFVLDDDDIVTDRSSGLPAESVVSGVLCATKRAVPPPFGQHNHVPRPPAPLGHVPAWHAPQASLINAALAQRTFESPR